MGELKYNTYRRQTAVAWITANPRAFFYLTVHRVFEFWFPNMAEGPYAVMISFITILSLAGFVLMARWRESFLQFAICASLVYPLTYYVVLSDSRYRIPILWISLLGAGYFMQAVWRLCPRWRTAHKNRKPIAAVTLPPGS
jgi:predicted neutral ceramidase superfamily lipid hydrolase